MEEEYHIISYDDKVSDKDNQFLFRIVYSCKKL